MDPLLPWEIKICLLTIHLLKKILLLQELAEPKTETPKEGYIGM